MSEVFGGLRASTTGSFDTTARLADLDADGIPAQMLHPRVTLAGARTHADGRELQTVCVRACNEWLVGLCAGSRPTSSSTRDDATIEDLRAEGIIGYRPVGA